METDSKKLSLIEKIKKLFEMAQRKTNNDGTSNEAEAAAAMSMAQQLLAKYNLDIRTIQDSATKDKNSTIGGPREKKQVKRSAMYRWQQYFWHELADANYCFHWVQWTTEFRWGKNRNVKRHVILGSEANVAVVEMMGDYLTETIERLVPYPKSECLSKSAISWREGCAVRLIERIKEKMEAMRKEGLKNEDGTTCTALAVRDMEKDEKIANYDAKYGQGAWARQEESLARWEAGSAQRQKEYAEDLARIQAAQAKETPAQRKAREAKEARQAARDERRWANQEARAAARLDREAYYKGRKDANIINLDQQLKGEK